MRQYYFLRAACLMFCLMVTCRMHAGRHTRARDPIVLQNSHVKAIFEIGEDGRLRETYYSLNASGTWTPVLKQFAPGYEGVDTSETQLWNTACNPYRFLIQTLPASALRKVVTNKEQQAIVKFSSREGVFTQTVTLPYDASYFHIEVQGALTAKPAKLDYCLSAYTFQHKGAPAFVHSPGLKFDDPRTGKGRDQILGDRAFHSPAVILQQDSLFTAMVPDLRLANEAAVLSPDARSQLRYTPNPVFVVPVPKERVTMPVGIDLNVNTKLSEYLPVMTYGMMDSRVGLHTRFVREEKDTQMVRTLQQGKIRYAFDLLLNRVTAAYPGYMIAAQHIWKHSGEQVFNDSPHLAMPYISYLELVKSKIFYPIRDSAGRLYEIPGGTLDPPVEGFEDQGSWLEWRDQNEKIGGFRCAAPFWTDVINNSVFWNQARDAVGMFYWGKELNDSFLISKARMMVNFCLKAPRNKQGLFSTVFNGKDKSWGIGWSDPPNGENRLFMRDAKSYEIPPLCKTGAHLLDYYMRAEKDQRIIDYLLPFADWLLSAIDDRGIIPSYVTTDMKISPIMYESAQPAAGMWFLAQMYQVTKNSKYLRGAEKIASYMKSEIIPTAKWTDMEQYVSCGQKPFSMVKDPWQGQWFRGNLCIMWACEGFAALYEATQEQKWLTAGEQCIDYLSLTQAAWSPRFVYSANPFGGFGTDNGDDAALMDQRQAEFVRSFIYYGLKLGRADLLQRGVAAGQAACVLINSPRHIRNGITPSPKFYPEGFAPENIDHEGISQWPMRTHPLWGEGIAVFTGLSEIRRELGGLYIDAIKNIVVGSDGIRVIDNSIDKKGVRTVRVESFMSTRYLKMPYEKDYSIPVVVKADAGKKVLLNKRPLQQGITNMVIRAER